MELVKCNESNEEGVLKDGAKPHCPGLDYPEGIYIQSDQTI